MKKTLFILFLIITASTSAFAISKDSANAVTMESYVQGWLDNKGTLALKNNTTEPIEDIGFQIVYLDMSGKPLDYEDFFKRVFIDPGMTKQINIPAYQHEREFSYYKSDAYEINPHKFKIKFNLKNYNQTVSRNQTVDNEEATNQSKMEPINCGLSDPWTLLTLIAGFVIIPLVITVVLFVIVAEMARKRNRDIVLWVALGFGITPVLCIILLLILGKAKDDNKSLLK